MQSTNDSDGYYESLPRVLGFGDLTEQARFSPLPDDWQVGVCDIVNSTGQIAVGRYKLVNMVGAAAISAVMNNLQGARFPFVFGGDGAGFAVGPAQVDAARAALAAVARWALAEFEITMRVALVPMSAVRGAGFDVRIARFQASVGADYAMFSGGGLTWAEQEMKAGRFAVPQAPEGSAPNLTGLSCRWAPMPSRNGTILSLVVMPLPSAPPAEIAAVYQTIIAITQKLQGAGNPVPAKGPGTAWPPAGAATEARAARGTGTFGAARRKVLFESLVFWILLRTGWKMGEFDARRYAGVVAENADFRKLDDGLKMTLDCDPQTQDQLETVLSKAQAAGLLRFGIATQSEAMMTCIVPSILTEDHVHFVDGAAGGYTQAATQMKGR